MQQNQRFYINHVHIEGWLVCSSVAASYSELDAVLNERAYFDLLGLRKSFPMRSPSSQKIADKWERTNFPFSSSRASRLKKK
jgi:hypothetical protein